MRVVPEKGRDTTCRGRATDPDGERLLGSSFRVSPFYTRRENLNGSTTSAVTKASRGSLSHFYAYLGYGSVATSSVGGASTDE